MGIPEIVLLVKLFCQFFVTLVLVGNKLRILRISMFPYKQYSLTFLLHYDFFCCICWILVSAFSPAPERGCAEIHSLYYAQSPTCLLRQFQTTKQKEFEAPTPKLPTPPSALSPQGPWSSSSTTTPTTQRPRLPNRPILPGCATALVRFGCVCDDGLVCVAVVCLSLPPSRVCVCVCMEPVPLCLHARVHTQNTPHPKQRFILFEGRVL